MGTRENEDVFEKRLSTIETKIDKLTELVTQTQLQEYRISVVEEGLKDLQDSVIELDKRAGNTALKWIGIIGTTLVTILLGFIAVKVGLK